MQRLADDGQQWSERKQAAGNHIEALAERQAASEEELSGYQHVPDNLAERRAKLADLLVEAEANGKKPPMHWRRRKPNWAMPMRG